MPSTLTTSIVTIAKALESLLNERKGDLGILAVYYGDQDMLATTPVVCVEPNMKENNLRRSGGGKMADPVITTDLLLYHGAVQSTQNNRLEADQFAEAVEAVIHEDFTLGGIIVYGHITLLESGYSRKVGTLYRSTKLTHEAITQGLLSS